MRLTDLFHLAETYFKLGIIAAGLITGIFCIGYFIIYRKLLHGTARFPLKKLAAAAVILCYLVVVLSATLLDRFSGWSNRQIDLYPFLSYREAWNSFSRREWRNLILNICMFVPFGLLLPLYGRRWQKAVPVYTTGLAFTLVIELLQLIFHRGIFELDDIFNNLLGTMIGYGLYRLIHFGYSRLRSCSAKQQEKGRQPRLFPVLLYQLPLIFVFLLFGTIFTVYHFQEFGNLSIRAARKINLSDVDVQLSAILSDKLETAPVYRAPVVDESETHALAQDFFARLGTQLDESQNDIYDETAVYWSIGRDYNLWIDYTGCRMSYTDFTTLPDGDKEKAAGKTGCTEEDIRAALAQLGVSISDSADFQEMGEGRYLFEADSIENGHLVQGTLTCTYDTDECIDSFDNSIITYRKFRDCDIISEQEAFDQLQSGNFQTRYFENDLTSMLIQNVRLRYCADSKGFYQPVYAFDVLINGEEAVVEIPALK